MKGSFFWCTVTRQQQVYQSYSVERVGSPSTKRCNKRTGKIRFPLWIMILNTSSNSEIDQTDKKVMLIGTSTVNGQKQAHGFAHFVIQLKSINIFYVSTRNFTGRKRHTLVMKKNLRCYPTMQKGH